MDRKSQAAPVPAQAATPPRETTTREAPHRETPRVSEICSGRLPPPTDGCKPVLNRAPHKPQQRPADTSTPTSHTSTRQPTPLPQHCNQPSPATLIAPH